MRSPEELNTIVQTLEHIGNVRRMMASVAMQLVQRGEDHDASKLGAEELETFVKVTPRLNGLEYNSPEYKASLAEMGTALAHHYTHNRHHPEFWDQNQEWRPVAGFKGAYEVSNLGRVRSVDREVERSGPTGNLVKKGTVLKQNITPKGYCRVQLQARDKQKNNGSSFGCRGFYSEP